MSSPFRLKSLPRFHSALPFTSVRFDTFLGFPFVRIYRRRKRRIRRAVGRTGYVARKEEARALVHARLVYWKSVHPFEHGQVRIKNTRAMWGSCSLKRNLNFNWRVVALSPELADYVVLHELCHTVHLDHSRNFWSLMEQLMPGHGVHRARLRRINLASI
jgi:predicted metal-dependent hydrolase